ncbi:TatD family hydrolase [Vibrio sp. TH_r3]|uniref:TatD family hydrolase n=1 Tax=Vibrio sp. TH_r3 TaxID=3082084 RepID=UPI0029554C11|nr:TatD family hydrolase [Vibrio sp. TH_r3]MDV7104699.1 TatD family hydrolase [Vibrio sp. TH_r3]
MNESSFRLFDTHCHLDRADFCSDDAFAQQLQMAQSVGVDKFLIPGCGAFNWDKIEQLCSTYPDLYFSLGLHPYYIDQHLDQHLILLDAKLSKKHEKCVAIGECGLDFYQTRNDEQLQKHYVVEQIRLANKYQLPLILHSRKSHQDMIKLLKQHPLEGKGIIHAFTGSYQQALDYINLGFYIGVGGSITYSRAKKTRKTISLLPLESLVLETDSPDMPLNGYQGEKNHPKNLPITLNELILLRSESEQTVAKQVYDNSLLAYNINY